MPDTETTRLLKSINVRPEQQIELAEMPVSTIAAAIAGGKAREGVRDLAGWVVSLLRAHRDHGWQIAPPQPRPDSPEALRAAFARYAVEQEAQRHEGAAGEQPWFPPPAPAQLNLPGAQVRLWNEIQTVLKAQVTRVDFDTSIRRALLRSVEDGVATLVVPSRVVKDAIETRFLSQLRELFTLQLGAPVEVRVILNGAHHEAEATSAFERERPAAAPVEPAPDPELRPGWIAAERWAALPALLRAALLGSTLVDGRVQAASPYLDRTLRQRYAREVEELLVE